MPTPEVSEVSDVDLAQVGHGDLLSTAESASEAGLQSPC